MTDQARVAKLQAELLALTGEEAQAEERERARARQYVEGVRSNLADFERQLALAKADPNLEPVARDREVARLKAEVAAAKSEIKRVS